MLEPLSEYDTSCGVTVYMYTSLLGKSCELCEQKDWLPDKFFQKDDITATTKKYNADSYCWIHLQGEPGVQILLNDKNTTSFAPHFDCL